MALTTMAKAIVGSLLAFLGVLAGGLQNSGGLTAYEWVTAAIAGLVSFSGIYLVPNTPPSTNEASYGNHSMPG